MSLCPQILELIVTSQIIRPYLLSYLLLQEEWHRTLIEQEALSFKYSLYCLFDDGTCFVNGGLD